MLRLGFSLPALMQWLGHKHIRMTLHYVQVTQQDLRREFHTARQHANPPQLDRITAEKSRKIGRSSRHPSLPYPRQFDTISDVRKDTFHDHAVF